MIIDIGIKTDKVIKDILSKNVLYTAIEDGSDENMEELRDIFINPSVPQSLKYIQDYPSLDVVVQEIENNPYATAISIYGDTSPANTGDMYLHAYTFYEFLLHKDYQKLFKEWYIDINKASKDSIKEKLINKLMNDRIFTNLFEKQNYTTYVNETLFPDGLNNIPENEPALKNLKTNAAKKIIDHIFKICQQSPIFLDVNYGDLIKSMMYSFNYFFDEFDDDYRSTWIFKPKWITYKLNRWGFMSNIYNGNYKNISKINKPSSIKENDKFIDIDKKNKEIILYNKKFELHSSPQSKIYYLLNQCLNSEDYHNGIIVRLGVAISNETIDSVYLKYTPEIGKNFTLSGTSTGEFYLHKEDYQSPGHANSLIIDTKNKKAIEVYIFDMNHTQPAYIRDFINRALENCETRYNDLHKENTIRFKRDPDNKKYLVKVITGKTLGFPPSVDFHGQAFDYITGGICGQISYYILMLWSRYHYIFGSFPELIKYIYNLIQRGKKINKFDIKKVQTASQISKNISTMNRLYKENNELKKNIDKLIFTTEELKSKLKTTTKKLKSINLKIKTVKEDIDILKICSNPNNKIQMQMQKKKKRLEKLINYQDKVRNDVDNYTIEIGLQELLIGQEIHNTKLINKHKKNINNSMKQINVKHKINKSKKKQLVDNFQYPLSTQKSRELWEAFENAIITNIIFSVDLFENDIIKKYLKTKEDESMEKWAEDFNKNYTIKTGGSIKRKKKLSRTVGGGKRTRKTKKVRKHRGIIQTGGNKGKLKKGYKYTGKRLKNGLSEIKKVKAKK